jgi:hypothetical protein
MRSCHGKKVELVARVARWYFWGKVELVARVARWYLFFQNQKNPNLGSKFEGLVMDAAGPFYSQLVHLKAIWSIFSHLVYFYRFGMLYQRKSGNPTCNTNIETQKKVKS